MNEQELNATSNSQTGSVVEQVTITTPETVTPPPPPPPANDTTVIEQQPPVVPEEPVQPVTPVQNQQPVKQPVQPPVTNEPPAQAYATVNEPYVKKIYDWAQNKGRVTVPYNDFKNQWFSDDKKAEQLFQKLSQASKYEDMGFDVGDDFNSFKKNVAYKYQKPITDEQKQNIVDGLNGLLGGINKTITGVTDAITKLPEYIQEGGQMLNEGIQYLNDNYINPSQEKKDLNKALYGNPNLSAVKSFGMTGEYEIENLEKEVPKLEAEYNRLQEFYDEARDWQKNRSKPEWTEHPERLAKFDDIKKEVMDRYRKYEDGTGKSMQAFADDLDQMKSELDYKKKILAGEEVKSEDPYKDVNQVALVDVKAYRDDPDYETKKARWIKNGTYSQDEINLAEGKLDNDKIEIDAQRKLFSDPSSVMNASGFYAEKKRLDKKIQQGLLEHQNAFNKKIDDQYKDKMTAIQKQYTDKASLEMNKDAVRIQDEYQKAFSDLIASDEDARILTNKFKEAIALAPAEKKSALQQQYNQALLAMPEFQKMQAAMEKEIRDSQKAILKKNDDALKKEYRTLISGAQKEFNEGERKWLAMQYDPTVNDKDVLTKWTGSVKKQMNSGGMDFDEKRKFMKKEWNSYLRTQSSKDESFAKKMANPTLRKQAEREFYFQFGDLFVDDKGQPTIYGIKSMAQSYIDQIDEQLKRSKKHFNYELADAYKGEETESYNASHNVSALEGARANFQKILDHDESDDGWFSELMGGLGEQDGVDWIPFVHSIRSIFSGMTVKNAADKLERGEALNFADRSLLNSVAAQKKINELHPPTFAREFGKGLAETIPMIGEFAITGKGFSFTKKTIANSIQNQVLKGVEKSFEKNVAKGLVETGAKDKFVKQRIEDLATKGISQQNINGLSTFLGTVGQTAINPLQYIDKTIQRMTPQVRLAMTDEANKLETEIESKGEDFWEAFSKATGSTWADMATERMGGHLMKTSSKVLKEVTGNPAWFKRSALGAWMTKRGVSNMDDAMKIIQREKLGWNGIIEENLEEYAAHALDGIITGDHDVVMSPREMLQTGLTTATLGGGVMKPVRAVGNEIVRRTSNEHLAYSYTDMDGKKQVETLTMPKVKWDQYSKLVNDPDFNPEKIERFVEKLDMDDKHKDALIQNYYTQNKAKIEGMMDQQDAKETVVPKPETMQKSGFDAWKEIQGFSPENPVSLVPQEVFDLNNSLESGKPDKKLLDQENLYMAEKWARHTRDMVVKNQNLSEEERQKSLYYLNGIISNIETEYEMMSPAETQTATTEPVKQEQTEKPVVSQEPGKMVMPKKPNIKVTDKLEQQDIKGEEGKDFVTVKTPDGKTEVKSEQPVEQQRDEIKQRNVKKNQEQTTKIIDAQKVISTPVYTSQDLFEKAVEANMGRKDLEKQLASANVQLAQIRKKETNLGSYTSRKKKAEIRAKESEIEDLKNKLTEAKNTEVGYYDQYAKEKKIDSKIAFAEVNSEIDSRVAAGEPVIRVEQPIFLEPQKRPSAVIDTKAARKNDIADLSSGKADLEDEVLDTLSLTDSELQDAKRELDLRGSKATNIRGLFDSVKKQKISVEKFYDVAKKYRGRDYAKQQQEKEKAEEKKKAAKKEIEDRQKSEATKASAEGTVRDTKEKRAPRKKKADKTETLAAVDKTKKYENSMKTASAKFKKAVEEYQSKEVDTQQLEQAMEDAKVKAAVDILKKMRKNVGGKIKTPQQLMQESKINNMIFGEYVLNLHKDGVINNDQKNSLVYSYSDIKNDVNKLKGVEQDALLEEKQSYLWAGQQGAISPPVIEIAGQDQRMPPAYLEPTEEFKLKKTDVVIQSLYKKLYKEMASLQKARPGLRGLKKFMANFKMGKNANVIYAKPTKPGSPLGLFETLQKYIVLVSTGRNNYDVFVHEVGHNVEIEFDLKNNLGLNVPEDQMDDFAKKVFNELKLLYNTGPTFKKQPSQEDIIREGFAEYIRANSINNPSARKLFPNLTSGYESIVPFQVRNVVKDIGDHYRMAASLSNLDTGNATTWTAQEIADRKKLRIDSLGSRFKYKLPTWFMKNLVDDRFPLQAMVRVLKLYTDNPVEGMNDPELLMSLLSGVGIKANAFMEEGLRDKFGTLKIDSKTKEVINYGWMKGMLSKDNMSLRKEQEDLLKKYMNSQRFFELQERKVLDQQEEFQREIEKLEEEINSGNLNKAGIEKLQAKIINLELKKLEVQKDDNIINFGSGVKKNSEVAQGHIDYVEGLKETNPEMYDVIKETARRYREMALRSMEYLVDKGKMSQSELDEIASKNQYYVALNRIEAEALENQRSSSLFRRDMTKQNFSVKKAEGSSRSTIDPFVSLFENMHKIVREGDRNELLSSITYLINEASKNNPYLARAMGGTRVATLKPNQKPDFSVENTIKVYKQQNGETVVEYWQFDESTQEVLKGLDGLSAYIPVVSDMVRFFKNFYTSTPKFVFDNYVRDTLERYMTSMSGSKLNSAKFGKKYKAEKSLLASTGGSQSYTYETNQPIEKLVLDYEKSLVKKSNWRYVNPMSALKTYRKWLRETENSNRVTEFQHSRKIYYQQMLAKLMAENEAVKASDPTMAKSDEQIEQEARGHSMVMAAYNARNLLDFYRAGTMMRYINQIIPFANSGVQGTSRYLQSIQKSMNDPQYAKMFIARNIIYAGLTEMCFKLIQDSMIGDDDEEMLRVLEQRDYLKHKYWSIATPYGDFTIAKPYSGWIFGNLFGRIYDSTIRGDEFADDNWYGFKTSLGNLALPLDLGRIASPFLVFSDIYMNRTSFGGYMIPPDEEGIPVEYREKHKRNTLSGMLEDEAGVDSRITDNVIRSFGQWGRMFNEAVNSFGDEGKKFDVSSTGFLRNDEGLFNIETYNQLKNNKTYNFALKGTGQRRDEDPAFYDLKSLETEYYAAVEAGEPVKEITAKITKLSRAIKGELDRRIDEYGSAYLGDLTEEQSSEAVEKMQKAVDQVLK